MDTYASIQNVWLIIAIWSIIYLADYYLTIVSAKNLRKYLQEYIRFEGSLELTPSFQKDVDGLRLISPQFLIRWLLSIPLIYIVWRLSVGVLNQPILFYFLVGALILRGIAVHLRHFRNLVTCSLVKKSGGLKGRIEYSRWFMLRLSAAEILSFCCVYLLFAIFLGSWFFAGGAVGCLQVAFEHWRLSKKAAASPQVIPNA